MHSFLQAHDSSNFTFGKINSSSRGQKQYDCDSTANEHTIGKNLK